MNVKLPLLVGVLLAATSAFTALDAEQAPAAVQAGGDAVKLTDAETNGKKMFQQRCSICHAGGTPAAPPYGGTLTSDNVEEGRETFARMIITQGSAKMPGFQYGLEPREIENIILYLKKVPGKTPAAGN